MRLLIFQVLPINTHILLAVCGGIAAYKSAELVRLLRKKGADVRVVMTRSAMQFISPLTFQALSGNPVHTELLDAEAENAMGHINLARWADKIIIAPATADTIAKLSHGLADDLLSTLCLAAICPIYIAPAMNQAMWHKPVTQENIQRLIAYGATIIGPGQGEQACGETGFGRLSEPTEICERLWAEPTNQHLHGKKILISAGPTREPLDPVRYITNRSSGKMGYALARAALKAGARVTLVSGPVALTPPADADVVKVETAAQMYEAVISRAETHDIYIGAAAVADYTPATVQPEKIKKQDEQTTITLQKTRDILAEVAQLPGRPFTVGFAAETHDLEAYALGKLTAKNLDMIAANWVGRDQGGFDSEQNALQVFWATGRQTLAMTDKARLAEQLISLIAKRCDEKNTA
ncbi:bifunctional phosphopantothenoylcysteine decarboxylase/phosphopantothenate--cysteine ligase CoaBC [Methylobacter sp.]|uniref:bifunctional phosphopantothenoylcysteine decarboxylase/phosphopantothenate--cysteine ligase CoaBC n=1 Tax=Methylobacter sp. TaxID=2051955 RepID=UPI003DA39884